MDSCVKKCKMYYIYGIDVKIVEKINAKFCLLFHCTENVIIPPPAIVVPELRRWFTVDYSQVCVCARAAMRACASRTIIARACKS